MKKYFKILIMAVIAVMCIGGRSLTADAKDIEYMSEKELLDMYQNAPTFDPEYYAANNPDVVLSYGDVGYSLYYHYSAYGRYEGRKPCKDSVGGEFAKWKLTPLEAYIKVTSIEYNMPEDVLLNGLFGNNIPWEVRQSEIDKRLEDRRIAASKSNNSNTDASPNAISGIVPINQLANYASVKKNMTDEEFQAAYNEALKIVQPLVGLSQEEQLKGICVALRAMADNGTVSYSETAPHYNDAYGYLINHVASCAGSARTTGLCLNMLGMSYEHVNENQWAHQWCRVCINGTIWIADPYGLTWMPETAPYAHPML